MVDNLLPLCYNLSMIKDKVLEILENNRTIVLSGERIAKSLGVSRAAVCKAVKSLREEGHRIYSCTNEGYSMTEESDVLSVAGIETYLNFKYNVIVLGTTDSTNKQAKIMALDGAPNGSVIVADEQTAGKGRRNRSFYSPKGSGVYFSIILRPEFDYAECQKIVPMAAVAVSRAIKKVCDVDVDIKWVNDIYLNGKKIVGISTESTGEVNGSKPESLIVGIGINVSTEIFPAEISEKAGSLGVKVNRNKLVAECINEFFLLYPGITSGSFIKEYRQKCFVLGKKVIVLGDNPFEAIAVDMTDSCELVVECNGVRTILNTEEVSVKPL